MSLAILPTQGLKMLVCVCPVRTFSQIRFFYLIDIEFGMKLQYRYSRSGRRNKEGLDGRTSLDYCPISTTLVQLPEDAGSSYVQ